MMYRWFGLLAFVLAICAFAFGPGCVSLNGDALQEKAKEEEKKATLLEKLKENNAKLKEKLAEAKEKRLEKKEERLKKLGLAEKGKGKEGEKDAEREATPGKAADLATYRKHLDEAKAAFAEVKDYTCVFIKQERVGGKLLEEQTAEMDARESPFAVHLKFTAPRGIAGQEACYNESKSKDKFRGKGAGIKGIVGFITLSVDDPQAMEGNRHTIKDSGIGKLIAQLQAGIAKHPDLKYKVTASEVTFDKRDCVRLEIVVDPPPADMLPRTVLYFDKTGKLPLKIENHSKGKDDGWQLEESYAFTQLKLNAGVKDEAFDK